MRFLIAAFLFGLPLAGGAQPADCPTEPSSGPVMPLALDLAGRANVPAGTTGQAVIGVPMAPPGMACHDAAPAPTDVLRGEPGDLLLGPGTPHVSVEQQ